MMIQAKTSKRVGVIRKTDGKLAVYSTGDMMPFSTETTIAIQDATYESLRGEREPEEFYEYKMSPEAQAEISIERFTWVVNCRAKQMVGGL